MGKAQTLTARSLQSGEGSRAQDEMMGFMGLVLRVWETEKWKPM